MLLAPGPLRAQVAHTAPKNAALPAAPDSAPPRGGGFFPLSEVHRGLMGTAWTVFTGSQPEPMQVEILGVLRGARGPGQDMILAKLLGAKPECPGGVAGMSGSPVYIGNLLLGSLSYRIGQFSKEPIASITPIAQMLEVRDLPIQGAGIREQETGAQNPMQQMETPLVMSGFAPEAIRLWQEKMAGTGLETVAAGGMGGDSRADAAPSAEAIAGMEPGSAVSAQLVRGDMEIAATCTVTYIDPKQLLACGHPILQAGPVSLPMTAADVVATLASPMNSFKIVNTGATIGAFTEDRSAAIRGVLGARARMIPVHIRVSEEGRERNLHVEILDLPSLTPMAMMAVVYEALLQTNDSTAETSYHLTGSIDLEGNPASPLELWAPSGETVTAPMGMALLVAEKFIKLYANATRREGIRAVNLNVEAIPHHVDVELVSAQMVSGDTVHAGDTVEVEATLRPWRQAERNVRLKVKLPDRLEAGNLRLLVSDAGTLDRTMNQPLQQSHSADLHTDLSEARREHAADRIYVSLLVPETQASLRGETLSSLPLSVANVLEPLRPAQDVSLNGESAELAADAPAGGVLRGFAVLNLRIEAGGGLN